MIGMIIANDFGKESVLVVSEKGYGKRTVVKIIELPIEVVKR